MTSGSPNGIEELLPLYVNGTLSAAEQARVEKALKEDPSLREDAEQLAEMRARMQAMAQVSSPAEFGLARLRRDIDRFESRRKWPLRAGLAAAIVAILAVGVTLSLRAPQPRYVQASGDTNTGTIAVTFSPQATEGAIRSLLLDNGLTLVNGPSALGIYHLKITGTETPKTALDRLRKQTGVVESATLSDE